MWRRVSCEQPLNTSQSILRLRGSLDQSREKIYLTLSLSRSLPKGNLVHIPEPGSGTVRVSYPSWQRDTTRRRPPELWEELSFLHKPPRPWNPLAGRMGFGFLAKSAAVLAASTSARRDLENPGEITADSHQLVPISAAGLQG
jgi:hypothetical protein